MKPPPGHRIGISTMAQARKTALVTGGAKRIGKAIVEAFASQGASVAFTYLSSREKAEAIASEWTGKGANVKAFYSDASSFVHAESLVPSVHEQFGRIDIRSPDILSVGLQFPDDLRADVPQCTDDQ